MAPLQARELGGIEGVVRIPASADLLRLVMSADPGDVEPGVDEVGRGGLANDSGAFGGAQTVHGTPGLTAGMQGKHARERDDRQQAARLQVEGVGMLATVLQDELAEEAEGGGRARAWSARAVNSGS